MRTEHGRLERLGRRVRWLDRWRRLVAIVLTIAIAPFMVLDLVSVLGTDWPAEHTTVLALMLGFLLWCAVEVGLAWITALWETEHARLGRQRGLPRARVIRRSRPA
jgi:hypothetical protein